MLQHYTIIQHHAIPYDKELYTGYPLYPGENEVEQLACIMEVWDKHKTHEHKQTNKVYQIMTIQSNMEVWDLPPRKLLERASRVKMFFDSGGNPRLVPNTRGKTRRPGAKDLPTMLRTAESKFLDCGRARRGR